MCRVTTHFPPPLVWAFLLFKAIFEPIVLTLVPRYTLRGGPEGSHAFQSPSLGLHWLTAGLAPFPVLLSAVGSQYSALVTSQEVKNAWPGGAEC